MLSKKMNSDTNTRNGAGCIGPALPDVTAPDDRFSPTTLGQSLNRLELADFVLTEAEYRPGTELPPHAHATHSLVLTLAGGGSEFIDDVLRDTIPGSLIIRPKLRIHYNKFGRLGMRCLIMEVNQNWAESFDQLSHLFAGPNHFNSGLLPSLAMRIYRESRIQDTAASIIVEGLMLEMLGNASRWLAKPEVQLPRWLGEARDILHGSFSDPLNLVQLAHSVGVHPTHLARSFKRHYRTTVGEYIRRLRLEWATKQLAETELPLADIAAAAGFYDQSHFSHTFKQYIGVTPAEFRGAKQGRSPAR